MRFVVMIPVMLIGIVASSPSLSAQLQVQVSSSVPSPQPVGTEVVFNFSAADSFANPGILNYKFEVGSPQATSYITIRDFEESTTFAWERNLTEGTYQVRVTARDSNYLTSTSQVVITFKITSRVIGSQSVVNPTTHPLVALFSAPECPVGDSIDILFFPVGSTLPPFKTNLVACNGKTSMNFLIGGLLPTASYTMCYQVGVSGGVMKKGPSLTWTSGAVPSSVLNVAMTFPLPFGSNASQPERIMIVGFGAAADIDARNTAGKLLWYYAGNGFASGLAPSAQLDRLLVGGQFITNCGYVGDYTGTGVYGNQAGGGQALQIIDLTGHVIQETNVDRVNEQLLALGTDPISTFNHDARILPSGNLIAVATIQRVFPAGTQGSTAPIDILGTMLVEFDKNLQVLWYWDAFDHDGGGGQLDINRVATLNEQCTTANPGIDGCPSVLLSSPANDWMHTNTLQYMQEDGSLVLSIRNQDWIAKIDFNNGQGTGNVIWIMGEDGNFAINNPTGDSWPWFSHQHDVEFQNKSNQVMTMFDNGNTRVNSQGGYSRGYVLSVDETAFQVTPTLLYDLGYYAVAQGSAQVLSDGDYMFLGGQIQGHEPSTQDSSGPVSRETTGAAHEEATEVTPSGTPVYSEYAQSAAYRMWRATDFYNVPVN